MPAIRLRYSSSEPSHQWTRAGWVSLAHSSTQSVMDLCNDGGGTGRLYHGGREAATISGPGSLPRRGRASRTGDKEVSLAGKYTIPHDPSLRGVVPLARLRWVHRRS